MSSKNLDRAQITAMKWVRQNYKTKLTECSLSEFFQFLLDLTPQKSQGIVWVVLVKLLLPPAC